MGHTAPLVIEIAGPDWAEEPGELLASVLDGPPSDISVQAGNAPGLSAYQAQILLAILHYTRAAGRAATLDLSEALQTRLALLGLATMVVELAGGSQ